MDSYSIQRKNKRPLKTPRKRVKRHQNMFQQTSESYIELECYHCHKLVKVTTIIACPHCSCRILQVSSDNTRTLDAI